MADRAPHPTTAHPHPGGPRVALLSEDPAAADALDALLAAACLATGGAPLPVAPAELLAEVHADVVVLGADVTTGDGLALLRRIRRDLPTTPVVVVGSRDPQRRAARTALNAGADGYVPEAEAPDALAWAVRAVVAGFVCVPRESRRLVVRPSFSAREKDVLGLLVTGLTNGEIAARLYLSESTVKSHLASSFAKLGVRSRSDAAAVLLDPAEGLAAIALPRRSGAAGPPEAAARVA